jgi:hypothetical protein
MHAALLLFGLDLIAALWPRFGQLLGDRAHIVVALAAVGEAGSAHIADLVEEREHRRGIDKALGDPQI